MDWPTLDLELSESHFEYFEYEHRMSTIVRKLAVDKVQLDSFGNKHRSDSLCSGASSLGIAVGSRMGQLVSNGMLRSVEAASEIPAYLKSNRIGY
jgi:hypothetical protein